MADTKSRLQFFIDVLGERKLKKLVNDIGKVEAAMKRYGAGMASHLDKADGRWKKHFDYLDKATRAAGGALTKFVGMSAKFATVQVGALGLAMMAVHGAFVLGNATMKAFRGVAQLAAGAAAGLTIALAAAAAAVREQQAAMFAYKGKGKNEFGSGLNQIRVEMRGLMMDAELAAVGTENLNAAFSAIAKSKGGYSQGAQALFKGLMDFASAGQDIKTGSKSAAELVAVLTDPKASFSKVTEAAKALGPEMEKALEEAKNKGIDTADELKKAILDGSLSVLGGVEGQFDAFNSTLINRGKAVFSQIKEMFADMGQPFLEPLKKELFEIRGILTRTFIRVSGDVQRFAQGNFIDNISVAVEKLANFFANLLHEYLPKVNGMFDRMGEWWNRFKDGWNSILDTLRPLIDAAKVLEKMFMEILRPIGDSIGAGFMEMRDLIVDNEKEFVKFGSAVGRFIQEFSDFASSLREIFVDALPFLTKVVDGATALFSTFTDVLGVLQKITGGMGAFGPMGLLAMLMSGGRGMKKTIGGQIFEPNTKTMNVTAGSVHVDGPGGRDLRRGTALQERLAKREAAAAGAYSASARSSRSARQVSRSTGPSSVVGPGTTGGPGVPTGGGPVPVTPGAYPSWYKRMFTAESDLNKEYSKLAPKGMTYSQAQAAPRINQLNRMRDQMRKSRQSYAATRMMGGTYGGKQFKGFNNSMGGMAAASLGLGLLSNVAGEEAQGALALGSMVGMYNPMAGLAVGLGGAALSAETGGGGALMGAGAGAAIGTMIAPGVGTAVGAIIGGIAGGISGALNKDKKAREAARKAGQAAMNNLTESALEGMSKELDRLGPSAKTTENMAKYFDNFDRAISDSMAGITVLSNSQASDDELRAYLQTLRDAGNVLVKDLTQADFDAMLKKPQDAIDSLMSSSQDFYIASDMIQRKYEARMPFFQNALGLGEEAIISLAEKTDTNLFDAFAKTEDMVMQLADGMIKSFDDVQRAAGQAMTDIAAIFGDPLKQMESTLAFDENMRNLRDMIDAGALVGDAGRMQALASMEQALPQLIGLKGGDALAGLYEFTRMFAPETGTLFTQQGGPLEGQFGLLNEIIGSGRYAQANEKAIMELSRIGTETLIGNLASAGGMFGEGQGQRIAEALRIGAADSTAKGGISETEFGRLQEFLATTDMTNEENQTRFANMINGMMNVPDDMKIKIEKAVAPLDAAALNLDNSSEQLFNAANAIIIAAGGSPSALARYTGSAEDGDTRTRRAIGDTGTNLSRTLQTHDAISGNIPGRRTITSSYRNFSLGSLNSDHLTGHALDLVGDNLVSYKDAVNNSGGFAEFHGGLGKNRHLHVVPSIGGIGDASMASPVQVPQTANGGAITVNNTFNISGTDGSRQELVQEIISKINSSVRDAKERS